LLKAQYFEIEVQKRMLYIEITF